ncbi:hypothetical protein HYALB_00005964 [Hymenoscyphus albidus]|uniref:Non-haem dioxygenase N-terminal domain-containing protein n=1 Tax=Hymenoscyphus albidus TaxID=595503 RepID=A0A9N9LA15_9HELO|nr:hypothetical protein HYALB_00005964 [Hymenoscyphus albidus]
MTTQETKTTKLKLRTALGRVYRDVLNTPPRDCTEEEIPVISLTPLFLDDDEGVEDGDGGVCVGRQAKRKLAAKIRNAAVETGFFYVRDHGIPGGVIERARVEGCEESGQTNISPGETADLKESFMWQYDPKYDPDPKPLDDIPEELKPHLRAEEFVWEGSVYTPITPPFKSVRRR